MRISEYQKIHNLTYKQVYDRIQSGEINARKRKDVWNIIDKAEDKAAGVKADGTPDGRMTQGGRLKDALTAMQIKKIQQHLEEGRQAIITEWLDGKGGEPGFRERFLRALEPLASSFVEARLDQIQTDRIMKGFEQSREQIKQLI